MIQVKKHNANHSNKRPQTPQPLCGESPTDYADRIGNWLSTQSTQSHKKTNGQYFTPAEIARFMASLFVPNGSSIRVLDPGAGCGILSCAVCEHICQNIPATRHIHLDLFETDKDLTAILETSLSYLSDSLADSGVTLDYRIHTTDFILEFSDALTDDLKLFSSEKPTYDLCISNPPYFKISKTDRRAFAALSVIHGQPNIYALFMAISAALLKTGGSFIFITPRSFASGYYFKKFRDFFFTRIRPAHIHLFDSRRDGFKKDGVLQEMIILNGIRDDHWNRNGRTKTSRIEISVSHGTKDLDSSAVSVYPSKTLLSVHSAMSVLRLPKSRDEERLVERVSAWPESFQTYGLRISTGPVVAFRAEQLLRCREQVGTTVPLLWLHHVHAMTIRWPIEKLKKPQFFLMTDGNNKLYVPNQNLVLLRRFSTKEENRRLVAAPYFKTDIDAPCLGLENHLNYIYRPDETLSPEEAAGLAILLNSRLIDTYFRVSNGNTQVGAMEISMIPLPPHKQLVKAGKYAIKAGLQTCDIESIANTYFEC